MTSEIRALINYRLEQADESLDSAQLLLDNDKFRPAINRIYYSMFYAILALLVPTRQQTSRHAWVITVFDRDFVKTGAFGKEFSRWLHEAFDLRQQADYQEMVTVLPEQAKELLEHARVFVATVKTQLSRQISTEAEEDVQ